MSFIIDTSVLIEIENGNQEIIDKVNALKDAQKAELCITIFNFLEFYMGAMAKSEKNKEKVRQRLELYRILQTTERTAITFCELYCQLQKKGALIPQFDLFIAAFAIEHGFTLVTRDHHFSKIPILRKTII